MAQTHATHDGYSASDYTRGYTSERDRFVAGVRYLLARDPVLWRAFDDDHVLA